MNYTKFNDLANTKENNFILIHPQGAELNTLLTYGSFSLEFWRLDCW
jgi:hypothetical protein